MHLALLRGINVGGNCKLPMKELSAIFDSCGATHVSTFIQSGNVLFRSAEPERITSEVTAKIARIYGYPGRIVLRSAAQLRAACVANPYVAAGVPIDALNVYFLADLPAPNDVAALDPDRSPGDSFSVIGREVFLNLPNGMGRTRLTNAWFDTRLKTVSTARNWKTTIKLLELMQN